LHFFLSFLLITFHYAWDWIEVWFSTLMILKQFWFSASILLKFTNNIFWLCCLSLLCVASSPFPWCSYTCCHSHCCKSSCWDTTQEMHVFLLLWWCCKALWTNIAMKWWWWQSSCRCNGWRRAYTHYYRHKVNFLAHCLGS